MTSSPADSTFEAVFDSTARWSRRVGKIALVSAVASRCLFPSEDASLGTGVFFIPLAFVAALALIVERTSGVRGPRLLPWTLAWGALVLAWAVSSRFADYGLPGQIMAWEWLATALLSLYALHMTATDGPGPIASLLVTLALVQAILAGYELGVRQPELRRRYEQNDPSIQQAMRDIGIQAGSPMEESFRQRLYSSEPMGTTGHPNSLAGILVLALPAAIIFALSSLGRRDRAMLGTGLALVILVALVATLLVSKSRSAWVASMVAVAALAVMTRGNRLGRSALAWVIGGGLVVSGMIVVLVMVGILDAPILTEASRSLGYRWEWWQATSSVIAESPWVGIGPGNFRSHYLAYKLPFSSEEISDPHNFVMELLATSGILGLAGYLAVLGVGVWQVFQPPVDSAGQDRRGLGIDGTWWFGAAVAVVMVSLLQIGAAELLTQPGEHPAIWAFVIAAVLLGFLSWTGVDGSAGMLRPALFAGVVGVHVHWLMAGGVAFPAMMALMGVAVGASARPVAASKTVPFWVNAVSSAALAAILLPFVFGLLVPQIELQQALGRSRTIQEKLASFQTVDPHAVTPEIWARQVPIFQEWAGACREVALTVPEDREGWERYAVAETSLMRALAKVRSPDEERAYRSAESAWQQVIALEPKRSQSYRQLGRLYQEAAHSGLDSSAMPRAVDALRLMVERYPNSAAGHYELADLLSQLNRKEEASKHFRAALELNRTPHRDKRLSEIQKAVAETYLRPAQQSQ